MKPGKKIDKVKAKKFKEFVAAIRASKAQANVNNPENLKAAFGVIF